MTKYHARLIFDAVLSVLLIASMLIQHTGVFAHEIVGAVFTACIVVHIALSWKWIYATARLTSSGKITRKRVFLAVTGALLGLAMLLLVVSSVIISTILASAGIDFSAFNSGGIWFTVHTASSFALSILTVIHLASHWIPIFGAMKVPYNPQRRAAIGVGVYGIATVGVVLLGITGAHALGLGEQRRGRGRGDGTQPDASGGEGASTSGDPAQGDSGSGSTDANPLDDSGEFWRGHGGKGDASDRSVTGAGDTSEDSSGGGSSGSDGGSSGKSGSSESDDPSTATGICPLCHKRCPLSDPQCDRPYREGLL